MTTPRTMIPTSPQAFLVSLPTLITAVYLVVCAMYAVKYPTLSPIGHYAAIGACFSYSLFILIEARNIRHAPPAKLAFLYSQFWILILLSAVFFTIGVGVIYQSEMPDKPTGLLSLATGIILVDSITTNLFASRYRAYIPGARTIQTITLMTTALAIPSALYCSAKLGGLLP